MNTTRENSNPPSSAGLGSETVAVDWDAKCQIGNCNISATHMDKYGILMCVEHMERMRYYTYGILPLSLNSDVSSGPATPEHES